MQPQRRAVLSSYNIEYTDLKHILSSLDRGGRCAANIGMQACITVAGVVFHNKKSYFLVKNV